MLSASPSHVRGYFAFMHRPFSASRNAAVRLGAAKPTQTDKAGSKRQNASDNGRNGAKVDVVHREDWDGDGETRLSATKAAKSPLDILGSARPAKMQDLKQQWSVKTADKSSGFSVPARYKLVGLCTLAFVVCNMDKVNMSVAIIPMAREFGWSPSTAGIVQASFFWGYMLSQIPAGFLANKFSGRSVLPGGVGGWSGFTAAVPLLASTVPSLCVSRALVGFGEGVAPSAINDIVAKAVPPNERARSISTIFGGLHVGSILGLLLAPPLLAQFGWPAVFYGFGALGLVWLAFYEDTVRSSDPEMTELRQKLQSDEATTGVATGVPYRAFLRNGPVRALMFTHFCNNWFHYTMLAWLPTYFTSTLSLNIQQASTVSLFPSIAGVLVSSVAGQIADRLIEGGLPVRRVRQLAQATAFMLPAALLCLNCFVQGTNLSVFCISAALGVNSFALAGLYCTHQDMSPRFAGPLLGLTNTSGAIPGIIGVATVGFLLDKTGSWPLALFLPICICFVLGTVCYLLAASSEEQDFSDNTPFQVERTVRGVFGKDE